MDNLHIICPVRGQLKVKKKSKDGLTPKEEFFRVEAIKYLINLGYPKENFYIEPIVKKFGNGGRNSFRSDFAILKKAKSQYNNFDPEQTWSVRTLQRNISSQYYYRMLKTQKKELVESEMKELTASYQNDKLEFIKNPVVAEFLGFSQNTDFTESDLEKSILSNLQKFLMELGKGYGYR